MGYEIERKFLVKKNWKSMVGHTAGILIKQGYLSTDPYRNVRIRLKGDQSFVTIKGKNKGLLRSEYEYSIPYEDAREMLLMCVPTIIQKIRYKVPIGKHIWEIDEFGGVNEGLVIAEIELDAEDEAFEIPNWVEQEVSSDPRYFNSNLIKFPYKDWKKEKLPQI